MEFKQALPESRKWGAVSIVAMMLISLALFSYWAVERNQRDFEELGNVDLPLFDQIQNLRTALVASESSVYEYYLTTNSTHFNQRYAEQTRVIEASLFELETSLGNDAQSLRALHIVSSDIEQTTREFRTVMTSRPIDWDGARAVLERFGPLTERAIEQSEVLEKWVQARIVKRTDKHAERVNQTLYLVAFLVALALVVSAWLGFSNFARLKALHEQQRLASFPRSNPNPVLALTEEGGVIYGNDAAHAKAIGSDLSTLLPEELYVSLTRSSKYREWEYEREGRSYTMSLGYLPEYGEYHAYISDITARKKAEDDLAYLAYHDTTTGLINRQQFSEFVDERLGSMRPQILVAILDMDLFDTVRAAAGLNVAEKVARLAAMRLQHTLTQESFFERSSFSYIDGGLFCFAYPNDRVGVDLIFHRMKESIARPFDIDGFEFYLSLNVGVVGAEHLEDANCDEALRLADGALRQSKKQGADQIVYYEQGIEAHHQYRLSIEHGLRHAIERDELEVFYQPKVCLKTGQINAAEALLRWRHPELGFVSPADFVPIAEGSGQILEIGQWVLDRVCEEVEVLNRNRRAPLSIAVNLSAKQLLYADIGASAVLATQRNDVPVSWIEFEITETAALTDFERALEKLKKLHALGFKISLDDFGTGYSSLSYLQQLPIDVLKIDRAFVSPLSAGCQDETLTRSIVKMAQQLNLEVVAEGVETDEQLGLLVDWGCEYIQGYLISKPLAFAEFLQFCDNFKGISGEDSIVQCG